MHTYWSCHTRHWSHTPVEYSLTCTHVQTGLTNSLFALTAHTFTRHSVQCAEQRSLFVVVRRTAPDVPTCTAPHLPNHSQNTGLVLSRPTMCLHAPQACHAYKLTCRFLPMLTAQRRARQTHIHTAHTAHTAHLHACTRAHVCTYTHVHARTHVHSLPDVHTCQRMKLINFLLTHVASSDNIILELDAKLNQQHSVITTALHRQHTASHLLLSPVHTR